MDPDLVRLQQELAETKCMLCGDMGMRIVEDESGRRIAERCECSFAKRALRALERANIPTRFEGCKFETFSAYPGRDRSIGLAAELLQRFVNEWPYDQDRKGLLLTGQIGAGKTHLAVATLRALIEQYNAYGVFCDHRGLLKAIQGSYSENSVESESGVLAPVFRADVLVLDDLGGEKRSDWTSEMVEHILNTRYNDRKTTIITTNFLNKAATGVAEPARGALQEARQALRQENLGDRVGNRIYSRLQEMCYIVELQGKDFRENRRAYLT